MKRTINAGIGGKSFIMDEDAYERLNSYLETFRRRLDPQQGGEIMDEIENRIAELLNGGLMSEGQTVSLSMINRITSQLGMPDGKPEFENTYTEEKQNFKEEIKMNPVHKLYLDQDDKKIAGVCSGLAAYFDIDVTVVRILMLVAAIVGVSIGFWIYIIIWIVAPKALTPAQKCELRGWETTAENLARFTDSSR